MIEKYQGRMTTNQPGSIGIVRNNKYDEVQRENQEKPSNSELECLACKLTCHIAKNCLVQRISVCYACEE